MSATFGDALVLRDATAPQGSVVFTPDGRITYFPIPAAEEARIEIAYVVADELGGVTMEEVMRVLVPLGVVIPPLRKSWLASCATISIGADSCSPKGIRAAPRLTAASAS